MAGIDLHTHSTASDGALSPRELVVSAIARGLDVIAITDHDTIDGCVEGVASAIGGQLLVLPGLELSVNHEGHGLHLLCYGFDIDAPRLATHLRAMKDAREERAREIVSRLNKGGTMVPWHDVQNLAHGSIGRPHIARALVELGHARDVRDAFARFIGEGRPAYVPSGHLVVSDAVELVRSAGGEVAIAHPLLPARPLDLEKLMPPLLDAGLTGLEVYHSEHDAASTQRLHRLAVTNGMWECGGSDFHGPGKPNAMLGSVQVPRHVLTRGPFAGLTG